MTPNDIPTVTGNESTVGIEDVAGVAVCCSVDSVETTDASVEAFEAHFDAFLLGRGSRLRSNLDDVFIVGEYLPRRFLHAPTWLRSLP